MSWSLSFKGKKADALVEVAKRFDSAASMYDRHDSPMRDEYRDVLAAKETALTMIASVNETPDVGDHPGACKNPGIAMQAYGSRSPGYGGSSHVSVDRVNLE